MGIIVICAAKKIIVEESDDFVGFVTVDSGGKVEISDPWEPAPKSAEMRSEYDAKGIMKFAGKKFPDLSFKIDYLDDDEDLE